MIAITPECYWPGMLLSADKLDGSELVLLPSQGMSSVLCGVLTTCNIIPTSLDINRLNCSDNIAFIVFASDKI